MQENGFLLKEHSEVLRRYCQKNNCHISFRAAGSDTLERIRQGNPCKGHDIMDKSIKKKQENWTYKMPQGKNENELENYKGLVGYSTEKTSNDVPELAGIWGLENGKTVKIELDKVETNQSKQTKYFTGDYDMHDLVKNGTRVLAGTPDENSLIDGLAIKLLKTPNLERKLDPEQRAFKSRYFLIRHGAQTNFISFLLSHLGETELKKDISTWKKENIPPRLPKADNVTKIDENVIMYDPKGKVYLLKRVGEVYKYYEHANLLNQIPFYFFIEDLKNNVKDNDNEYLQKCATEINKWLNTVYGEA